MMLAIVSWLSIVVLSLGSSVVFVLAMIDLARVGRESRKG